MRRCILLKLVPGTDPVEVQEKLWKGFNKLDDAMDWLNHPVIYRSCKETDDFDLMIRVDIDEEERLPEYLSHPLTIKLEDKVKAYIRKKRVFHHY